MYVRPLHCVNDYKLRFLLSGLSQSERIASYGTDNGLSNAVLVLDKDTDGCTSIKVGI